MKMKNVLTVFAFVLAIGSAVGSSLFAPQASYTSVADVPVQLNDCVKRADCPGGTSLCKMSIDHDNNASTPQITVQRYDGSVDGPSDDSPICGDNLFQP